MKMAAIIFFVLLLPSAALAAGNEYGVFVGVGKYPREADVLSSSANDAREMCKAYSSSCGNGTVKLLRDESATRQNILQSILGFQKIVMKGDLFVFYYSGHGTLFPDRFSEELDEKITVRISKNRTGEKFDAALIPYDSTQNSDEKTWRNLILDDELYKLFAGFTQKGARVIFISDSCYSGGQAKGGLELSIKKRSSLGKAKFLDWKDAIGIKSESELKKGVLIQKDFKSDSSLENRYIMVASSGENQASFSQNPDTGMQMSLFTYYFLDVFNKYKKSGKVFTFETVINEVNPQVVKYAEANGESQSPKIDVSFYKESLRIPVFKIVKIN